MKRTSILAEEELLYKLDRLAREQGRAKSELIREALVEYVVKWEAIAPPTNPLLGLIGLAGEDAAPMDLADGKDEEMVAATIDPQYGFTATIH